MQTNFLIKTKGKKEKSGQVATTMKVDEFVANFKKDLSLCSLVSRCDSNQLEVEVDERWIVDTVLYPHDKKERCIPPFRDGSRSTRIDFIGKNAYNEGSWTGEVPAKVWRTSGSVKSAPCSRVER